MSASQATPITPAIADSIVADYQAGQGFDVLGAKYHMGEVRLHRILLAHGVTLRVPGGQATVLTAESRRQLADDYRAGATQQELRPRYHLNWDVLRAVLVEQGETIRFTRKPPVARTRIMCSRCALPLMYSKAKKGELCIWCLYELGKGPAPIMNETIEERKRKWYQFWKRCEQESKARKVREERYANV